MENKYKKLELIKKINNSVMPMISYWGVDGDRSYANLPFISWSSTCGIEMAIRSQIRQLNSEEKPVEFHNSFDCPNTIKTDGLDLHYEVSYFPDIECGKLCGYIVKVDPSSESDCRLLEKRFDGPADSPVPEKSVDAPLDTPELNNILETIEESFCVIDGQWNIRYWNNSAERTTGQNKQDIIGKNMWQVFPKEKHSPLYVNCLAAMESRRHIAFEHNSITGTWYYNSVHPNEDGGITIYFKDVTDRKIAENQVVELHENLDALLNATEDLMWSIDTDHRLISANKAFSRFVLELEGYHVKVGDKITVNLKSGKQHKDWIDLYERCLLGEAFSTSTLLHNRLTRFNPIFKADGSVTGVACHSMDVSEINRLERENSAVAERFQALIQNGSDFIFIFGKNYHLEYASPSALAVLGQKFLESKQLAGLIHSGDYPSVAWHFREYSQEETFKIKPFRIRNAEGRFIWIEAIVDNLLDNAAVAGIVINARDVTVAMERQKERETLIGELVKSNSDLTQFSYITSHNLRAPLSNIMGILNHMDRSGLSEESQTCLSMLDTSASDLNRTLEDLSEVLRIKVVRPAHAEVLDLKECFINANRPYEKQELEIGATFEIKLDRCAAFFNKCYLENIFSNLISNSIKFRSPKRSLHVKVSSRTEEDGTVRICFEDNGLGFDTRRHKDRIFGMYQRFHGGNDGKGLGLFLTHAQLGALGGAISVESVVGAHTAFTIVLPA